MAMLPVRRSGGRTLTVVNPSREFEDIYDRMGQLMNLAFGLGPVVELGDQPWAPLADRGGDPLGGSAANVARREDAGLAGLQRQVPGAS